MNMVRILFFSLLIAGIVHAAPLRVVASTADLAAVVRQIGGANVDALSICAADQDPHSVELLPAHVISVSSAVVYFMAGVGLDPWAESLVKSSDNASLVVVDCSAGIEIIREPDDDGHGHHPLGNPHYMLGPTNLIQVARNVTDGLLRVNPEGGNEYRMKRVEFEQQWSDSLAVWKSNLASCTHIQVVVHHATWEYFARDFGWTIVAAIESHAGIEPSPREIAEVESVIGAMNVKLCLAEPYATGAVLEMVARDTGIEIVRLPVSVRDVSPVENNFTLFRKIVDTLLNYCSK